MKILDSTYFPCHFRHFGPKEFCAALGEGEAGSLTVEGFTHLAVIESFENLVPHVRCESRCYSESHILKIEFRMAVQAEFCAIV